MHLLWFFLVFFFLLLIVLGTIDYVEITGVLIPFSDYMSKIIVLDLKKNTLLVFKCS